ncbi:MAG: hypothetical protein K6E68_00240 [Lachnospiraceae bacterium]|nr:hypothetical protein [Lachnospiraceae bacterium]
MSTENEVKSPYDTKSVEQNEELQTGILNELHALQKKTLMYQRLSAGLMLVFVIAVLCVIPSLLSTLKATRETLAGVDAAVAQANEVIAEANGAVAEVEEAMNDLSNFVNTAGEELTSVADGITQVDFETLNRAIENLDATVQPFANFFSKFK